MVLGRAKVSKLVNEPTFVLVRSFTGKPRFTLLKTLKFCQANDTDCRSVIWKVLPSSQSASKKPGPRSELRPAFPSRKAKVGSLKTIRYAGWAELQFRYRRADRRGLGFHLGMLLDLND